MMVGATKIRSIERALQMLRHRSVVFFDVWPEDGVSLDELCMDLRSAHCRAVINKARGVVTVFNGVQPPMRSC
jgi:hypothetical protein